LVEINAQEPHTGEVAVNSEARWMMSAPRKGDSKEQPITSSDDIRHLAGPIADHTVMAILEAEASIADLEAAVIYARGEGDYVDRLGHPLAGKVAQLTDILAMDEFYATNNER
jgi:hypothetical protein